MAQASSILQVAFRTSIIAIHTPKAPDWLIRFFFLVPTWIPISLLHSVGPGSLPSLLCSGVLTPAWVPLPFPWRWSRPPAPAPVPVPLPLFLANGEWRMKSLCDAAEQPRQLGIHKLNQFFRTVFLLV